MIRIALAAAAISGLTACSTLVDGMLGRYHAYDAVEYAQTVDLLRQSRLLVPACADPVVAKQHFQSTLQTAESLQLYLEGRPHNQKLVEIAVKITGMLRDSVQRDSMSRFFCQERARNITQATELLRRISGEKTS